MRPRNLLVMLLILLVIAIAIISPTVYAGYNDLRAAQMAESQKQYSSAAALYESAANKLFWRNDLWGKAGLADYQAGDNQNAIRLLEIARQKKSISAQGWDALGSAYWNTNDHTSALLAWQTGSQANPSYAPLLDHLATAYDQQGNYPSEQTVLEKRLAIGDDATSHYRLGLILTLSDIRRAQMEFTAAASLDPEFDSAVQTLTATLNVAALQSNPSQRLVVIGRGLGLVNEWGLASKAFEEAVSADADNAEAWAWLGEARQHEGQDGSAELGKALALDPRDTVVRALRGLYWKRQGKYAQALAEYLQAAQIEPDNPVWQASIADAYTQTGDLVSALAAYQKATTLAPNDATYWRLLAMFCADNGVQVLDVGLPAAQKAAEIAPKDPQVLDALGWTYLKAGYPTSAQENLQKSIEAAPDVALTHLHLAETYLNEGNKASAFNELNLARQLDANGSVGQFAAELLKQYFP
ncbi:MAG: tetratricopeptide repeat protein [Chloroflexi bacterium]|nr:tetratricopeptide repeat protein [Chloroflexota bacterium]